MGLNFDPERNKCVLIGFQKPDDEDAEFLSQEEDFRLPQSYFADEEN